jgi:hypothetical protein
MSDSGKTDGAKTERNAAVRQREKGRRRSQSRRWITLIAATLFTILPTAVAASPANAAVGGCSIFVDSGFNWTQQACLGWTENGMVGTSDTFFETGFNRGHVTACTWYGTIVSSYGTTTTYHIDCLFKAQAGGEWVWTQQLGPGRNFGDTYTWHTCMIVQSAVRYDSCKGSHPISRVFTL